MNNKQLFFFNKGQSPKNMERISIVTRQTSKSLYETDDVLQLQCIGEVESINAMPSKVGEHSYANIHKKCFFDKIRVKTGNKLNGNIDIHMFRLRQTSRKRTASLHQKAQAHLLCLANNSDYLDV